MAALRAGLAVLVLCMLAGCGTAPPIVPMGTSANDLKQQNKALFLMGGRITNRFTEEICFKSAVEIASAKAPSGAQQTATLTSRPIAGTNTRLFSMEVAPGTYSFERFGCDRAGGLAATRYKSPPNKPFATFSIEAGEVVDLGVLSFDSSDVDGKYDAPFGAASSQRFLLTFVDDMPAELRAAIPESLVSQVKTRHMTPSTIVDPQELIKRCSQQRDARARSPGTSGASGDPPVCQRIENRGTRTSDSANR